MPTQNLWEDYKRLQASLDRRDYKEAVEVSDVILGKNAKEKKAAKSKIYALIYLGRFKEAVEAIEIYKDGEEFRFEKAYAKYGVGCYQECLELLDEKEDRMKLLKSQVYYVLEDRKALELWEEVNEGVNESEWVSNWYAIAVRMGCPERVLGNEEKRAGEETYEMGYNVVCALIALGEEKKAKEKLKDLREREREVWEDELERARVEEQFRYLEKWAGDNKNEIGGEVELVSENNLAIWRSEDDPKWVYEKLSELWNNREINKWLSKEQRATWMYNLAIMSLRLGQTSRCHSMVKEIEKIYPEFEWLPIIKAAIHHHDKNVYKAIEVLKDARFKNKRLTDLVELYQAQIYLNLNKLDTCASHLSSISSLQHELGMIAALVHIYQRTGQVEHANQLVWAALESHPDIISSSDSQLIRLVKHYGKYLLKHHHWTLAFNLFQKILDLNPLDLEAKASLTVASIYVNSYATHLHSSSLESFVSTSLSSVDIDALENLVDVFPSSSSSSNSPHPTTSAKKKKKRRPNKPSKRLNRDKPPDPNRWLSKKQRAALQPAKTQGSTLSDYLLPSKSPQAPPSLRKLNLKSKRTLPKGAKPKSARRH
ncbi:signal recognition particle subunit SRP72-like [Schistocerca gregaria]|uniref:signal recognition particle subunit SRP72-like n=1 Tax=Schistocerca gregaria TaxID=7010 RepID=UPI00211F0EEF|nr:signal recognition particle subunit SRP72-like [Schistocerca gregaria]XP_049848341.1 signal recognition particle subunit SRP72-like [Schistocerca gregaria]XP_049848342.1 signal recognition particle subunit SRP72-like [Schistocerca gregaria]